MSTITTRERFVARTNSLLMVYGRFGNIGANYIGENTLVVCGCISSSWDGVTIRVCPLTYYLKNKGKINFKYDARSVYIHKISLIGESLTLIKNKKPMYLIENGKDGKATIKIANAEGIFPESKEVPAEAKAGSTATGAHILSYRIA